MPEERRQGYELISTQLSAVQEKLGTMHTELALNTRETSRIAKAQETTNGKVAAHEVRQQALEANQAVMATALAKIETKEDAQQTKKYDWFVWVVRGFIIFAINMFGLIMYQILTKLGFFNFPS